MAEKVLEGEVVGGRQLAEGIGQDRLAPVISLTDNALERLASGLSRQLVAEFLERPEILEALLGDRPGQFINGGLLVRGGLLQVNAVQNPVGSTSPAYTAADAIGGGLEFPNAVRAPGGSGLIQALTVLCRTQALVPLLELVLFSRPFTATADNAAFSPSDADMANCIGVIKLSDWADYAANSIATRSALAFPFSVAGTSLYGQLVTRTAITLGSALDLSVGLQIIQD